MKRKIFSFVIMFICISVILCGHLVSAKSSDYVPYEHYTYWNDITGGDRKSVYNRPMFDVKEQIDFVDLGIEAFTELTDVCTDKYGNIYLLDSQSRLVLLDHNYKYLREITQVISDEENYKFEKAASVYVHTDKTIFICDTQNQRVLHCDEKGNFIDKYLLPDSTLIPENFEFRPIRVVADSKNYVYILSQGSYYGALLYAPDKSFIGFYGSNTVTNGIIGSLKSLIDRMFPNNTKKSNAERALPYSFTDIVVDGDDFIYTATDNAKKGQIKKLNPGLGSNILDSDDLNFGDDKINTTHDSTGQQFTQKISGLGVDENGFIYCLDISYGRIFAYDAQGRMITAFGGGMENGTQKGNFTNASAIAVNGKDVLVCDKTLNTLTVFTQNSYGEKVFSLTKMTIDGDYAESKQGWQEVLKLDRNLQIAYTGISRAYISDGEYEKAIDAALEGYDRDTYSIAFEYYRTEWLSNNFVMLAVIAITVTLLIASAVIVVKRKHSCLVKDGPFRTMLNTLVHPATAYEDIKYKKKGSVKLALIVLAVFYITAILKELIGGFLFTEYDPGTFNSFWVFVKTIGLVVLWVISNWLVSTLSQGKGKMKEIFIVTCYSLIPIIFERIIWIILSHFLLPKESSILFILQAAAMIYAFIIFVSGMLCIHDYTMMRFIGTGLLSVMGIAALVFLIVLVAILVQQEWGFFTTLFLELFM